MYMLSVFFWSLEVINQSVLIDEHTNVVVYRLDLTEWVWLIVPYGGVVRLRQSR